MAKILPNLFQTISVKTKREHASDYEKIAHKSDDEEIDWDESPLAKTLEIYRTVEMTSVNASRRNSSVDLLGSRVDCYHGYHGFRRRSRADSDVYGPF
jgi:hypothetical protein